MKFFLKWISYSILILFLIVVAIAGTGIAGLYYFGRGLPDHHSLEQYKPNVSSSVFLDDGSLLKEFAFEKRHFISIEQIPEKLKNAFLAAEDKNFYEHIGVDPSGMVRSLFNNIMNLGTHKRPQGASTITQQVARIFLVGNNELSYVRKIREAILAFRIENSISKGKILELYLNQIYLGAGSYGVSAAAKRYFNKSLDQLTTAECALLASLAKGASYYNPIKYHDRALTRRNWVLKRMFEVGFITKPELENALQSELKVSDDKTSEEHIADYYAEEIRKDILNRISIESINKEGLVIRAPLNVKYQKAAEKALKNGLEKLDRQYGWRGPIANIKFDAKNFINDLKKIELPVGSEKFLIGVVSKITAKSAVIMDLNNKDIPLRDKDLAWTNSSKKKLKVGDVVMFQVDSGKAVLKQVPLVQGAILVMDPHSGKVLALQGGYDFDNSKFNRATQAMRQPGSCFKPFVYMTALESGYTPASIIDGRSLTIDLGNGVGVWTPKNFRDEIVGDVTLRMGLEKSLNTVTVRIAQLVGIENIAMQAEKFGVFETAPRIWSIVLGAGETTLLRMVTAYSQIINGGYRVAPTFIEQVQDKNGKTIYRSDNVDRELLTGGYDVPEPPVIDNEKIQIIDPRTAYQATSLMCGSVLRGTSRGAKQLNIPLAGKTGTSNDSKDNWFIGCTPNLVVGVLVCFDDNSKSLGKNAVGATTALPIFVDFMRLAKLDKSKVPFKVPAGIIFKNVNRFTGKKCAASDTNAILEAFKEEDRISEFVVPSSLPSSNSNLSSDGTFNDTNLDGIY